LDRFYRGISKYMESPTLFPILAPVLLEEQIVVEELNNKSKEDIFISSKTTKKDKKKLKVIINWFSKYN
jgi:hypothetical protein